jgi:hypothetical protein
MEQLKSLAGRKNHRNVCISCGNKHHQPLILLRPHRRLPLLSSSQLPHPPLLLLPPRYFSATASLPTYIHSVGMFAIILPSRCHLSIDKWCVLGRCKVKVVGDGISSWSLSSHPVQVLSDPSCTHRRACTSLRCRPCSCWIW